jgi:L-asparaginase II
VAAEPFLVAGTARCCTAVMEVTGAAAFVKGGAEGFYAAALPGLGLGLALKIDDGARRAAEVALIALLRYLGVLDTAGWSRLAAFAEPEIANWAGYVTGGVRAAPGWPE